MQIVKLNIESQIDRRQLTGLLAAYGYKVWESNPDDVDEPDDEVYRIKFEIAEIDIEVID